jgi:hypothetical protein
MTEDHHDPGETEQYHLMLLGHEVLRRRKEKAEKARHRREALRANPPPTRNIPQAIRTQA